MYDTANFIFKRAHFYTGVSCTFTSLHIYPKRDCVVQLYWYLNAFCAEHGLSFYGWWLYNLGVMDVLDNCFRVVSKPILKFWAFLRMFFPSLCLIYSTTYLYSSVNLFPLQRLKCKMKKGCANIMCRFLHYILLAVICTCKGIPLSASLSVEWKY